MKKIRANVTKVWEYVLNSSAWDKKEHIIHYII